MKNSKIIFLIIIGLLILGAGVVNFSKLKNSFLEMKSAVAALKIAETSAIIDPSKDPAFNTLTAVRDKLALVAFEKEDLALFQKFFPTLLEKSFGLSSISLNITKQYAFLNNKKIFKASLQFTGDYRQFLKAINDNFPSVFVSKLGASGNSFSADLYGYVMDEAESFVFADPGQAYSIFEQIGVMLEKDGKPLAGSLTFTEAGKVYFLKPMLEAKSYLVCKNAVSYINKNTAGSKTLLILPINTDLSIQE